jgi:sugar diacid utilization regulator
MEARTQQIADAMVLACQEEIPQYAMMPSGALEGVRKHSADHVGAFIRMVRSGSPPTDDDLEFVRDKAAQRAREGMPVELLLRAYRMGQREVWRAVVEAAGDDPELAQAALSISRATMTYTDAASTQASVAYVEVQRRMLADRDRSRREMFDDLLAKRDALDDEDVERAAALGLHASPGLLVVGVLASARDPEGLHRVEELLGTQPNASGPSFTVVRRSEVVAVVPASGDDGGHLARALAPRVSSVGSPVRLGISRPASCPIELARAYAEARAALQHADPAGGVVALADVTLFDYLATHADSTARQVVPARARRLFVEDERQGGRLLDTVRAFAEADLKVARAAKALDIHPNTLHYRLRKIEEIAGISIRRFSDWLDLLAAIRVIEASARRDRIRAEEDS